MSKFSTYWQSFRRRIPSFSKGSEARKYVTDFVTIYCGVYLFTTNVLGFTVCVGPSMLPTIDAAGELALIDRLSYKLDIKDYKIGDVVISKSMDDPNKTVCKRIKGVAGDMVYFKEKHRAPVVLRVPEGHVWLLGDNPSNSNDSRFYGPVPLGMLQGRIFFKIGLNPPHASLVDTIYLKVPDSVEKKKEEKKEENKGDRSEAHKEERQEEVRKEEQVGEHKDRETENK